MAVHRERIITAAARHKLPAVHGTRFMATAGGLMSYGPPARECWRYQATVWRAGTIRTYCADVLCAAPRQSRYSRQATAAETAGRRAAVPEGVAARLKL